ncbi:MAG: hypothetical protein ACLQHA_03870 [Thermoplasmata archaeon]
MASPDFSVHWSAVVRSRPRFGQSDFAEILESRFGLNRGYAAVYAGYVLSFAKAAGLCHREITGRKYVPVSTVEEAYLRPIADTGAQAAPTGGQTTLLDDEIRRRTSEIAKQLRGATRLWNTLCLYLTTDDDVEADRYRERALSLMEHMPLGFAPQGREVHHEMGRSVLAWARRRLVTELESKDRKGIRSTLQLMEQVLDHLESADKG